MEAFEVTYAGLEGDPAKIAKGSNDAGEIKKAFVVLAVPEL